MTPGAGAGPGARVGWWEQGSGSEVGSGREAQRGGQYQGLVSGSGVGLGPDFGRGQGPPVRARGQYLVALHAAEAEAHLHRELRRGAAGAAEGRGCSRVHEAAQVPGHCGGRGPGGVCLVPSDVTGPQGPPHPAPGRAAHCGRWGCRSSASRCPPPSRPRSTTAARRRLGSCGRGRGSRSCSPQTPNSPRPVVQQLSVLRVVFQVDGGREAIKGPRGQMSGVQLRTVPLQCSPRRAAGLGHCLP